MSQLAVGTIGWFDLTVVNAEEVRDFYRAVVGWSASPVEMNGYEDYCMHPPGQVDPVAGVCHARRANADVPPAWIMYIVVGNLETSLAATLDRGGQLVSGSRQMGTGRFAIIRDPAGAAVALFQAE